MPVEHGFGRLTNNLDDIYEGQFQYGKRIGSGKIIYSKKNKLRGWSYKGEWGEDKSSGNGAMIAPNGEIITGEWTRNMPESCNWYSDGRANQYGKLLMFILSI